MSAERAKLEPLSGDVIAGSGDQSRVDLTPGEGTLGERSMVPRERERTQRKDELRLRVGENTAEGLFVRAKRAPLRPNMDEWDDHPAAGHAGYRGWCMLCGAGEGDRVSMLDRWSVVHSMSCKGTQHRWIAGKLVGNVIMNDMQILVVKSDQEMSTMKVKNVSRRSRVALRCPKSCQWIPRWV